MPQLPLRKDAEEILRQSDSTRHAKGRSLNRKSIAKRKRGNKWFIMRPSVGVHLYKQALGAAQWAVITS